MVDQPLVCDRVRYWFNVRKKAFNVKASLTHPSYLFSLTAFNAIIGAQAVCQITSFGMSPCFILSSSVNTVKGFPAFILLLTKRSMLLPSPRWDFGVWSNPVYIVAILYSVLVIIVAFVGPCPIPDAHSGG